MKYYLTYLVLIFNVFLIFGQESEYQINALRIELNQTKTDTQRIRILNELGIEYLYTDTKKAMSYLQSAIKIAEKIQFLDGLSKSYVYYGIAYYYNYEYDSTLKYYNKSLAIKIKLNDSVGIAKVESNIGIVYHNQSKFQEAIIHYKKGLNLREKTKDYNGISESYNNIGAIYYDQGNLEMALEYYFKSLQVSEANGNKIMISSTLANIGGIYEEQEKFDRALEYHQKANAIAVEINDTKGIADTYANIAGIFTATHLYDSARTTYLKALSIYIDQNDIYGKVIIYNQLGDLLINEYTDIAQNRQYLVQATEYFQKSIDINQADVDDRIELCLSYQGLGDINLISGKFTTSINYLNKALQIANNIKSGQYIKGSLDRLSLANAKIGNYQKAYEYHVAFKNWNDSLRNDENIEALTQVSMQYEFDKQQKEQEFIQAQKELEYEQKLQRQRLIRYTFIGGFVLVLLFSLQVLRSYQRKKKDNLLLAQKNVEIERQKEEITDSIKYAKRIQNAILPSAEHADEILPEHFILFRPRDIVSGDYFWMNKVDQKIIVTAADCTGHGVPGAFMSMLGVSFLNEIVNKNKIYQPHLILNHLRNAVKRTLGQTGKDGEAKDGMDIALCTIDTETMMLEYAGAYNPLFLFRQGELIEVKADKMPIGIYIREKESFTKHDIQLEKGDTIYIFSDGYADQFGGPDGSKFKSKPFKRLLGEIQSMTMKDQGLRLNRIIDDWRGEIEQIDDIIILGIRF